MSVRIDGTYSYDGKVNSIEVKIGQKADLSDVESFRTILNGKDFNVTITDLQPLDQYYYCFEVDYGATTTHLTEVKTFITEDYTLPTVITGEVDSISENVAHGYGEVTSNGGGDLITIRGLCWGIEHNPTIGKAYVVAGAGLGAFDGNMTELLADQTYYVRAFAGNSKGVAYGNEMSFITRPSGTLPTVATTEIIQNGSTSLTIKGIVSDEGASAVVIKGICWGICPNPEKEAGA